MLTYFLTAWSRVLLKKITSCSLSSNSVHFMEPVILLPSLQEPTTCPYSRPDQSSPYPSISLPEDPFQYYLPINTWVYQVVSSPQFPHQNPVYTSALPHTCYMPHPSNYSLFDHLNNIWWGVQSLSPSFCSLLHSPVTSSLSGQNIPLSTLFSNKLSLHSFLNVSNQVSHPYNTTGKIIVLYILIFIFLDCKLEDIRYCTK